MNYSILKPLYKINLPVHVFAVRKLNPLFEVEGVYSFDDSDNQ